MCTYCVAIYPILDPCSHAHMHPNTSHPSGTIPSGKDVITSNNKPEIIYWLLAVLDYSRPFCYPLFAFGSGNRNDSTWKITKWGRYWWIFGDGLVCGFEGWCLPNDVDDDDDNNKEDLLIMRIWCISLCVDWGFSGKYCTLLIKRYERRIKVTETGMVLEIRKDKQTRKADEATNKIVGRIPCKYIRG